MENLSVEKLCMIYAILGFLVGAPLCLMGTPIHDITGKEPKLVYFIAVIAFFSLIAYLMP